MKKMTGNEIRQTWLNFFKSKGHMIEPGASLIPHNDKTLLWINSGVAALKKYFDGSEIPDCRRITNVQKSIRTNDITNVGKTARHHTFFEMLGNFSIGDYFRDEVIPWAYEILTSPSYFGMDPENLYFTYNPTDKETFALWKKCGVKESHLIPLEGNYWEIGAGPCGPNTEVFYDRGESWDKDHLGIRLLKEDIDNDRYIELWGIVFSQYNAEPGKPRSEYKELPSKNIDTGAGLERIACILQGAETNFDTDLFMPVINATQKLATKPYADPNKMAYRVIADHIKTITFAIADGEYFSNEGRGYVLRRLLRRAMRYGQKIGINTTFMFKLVPVVKDMMKSFYPYLEGKEDYIAKIVKGEEEKFLKTLGTGEALLDKAIEGKKELSGADAFKLYDTFGFPIEMTKEICEEKGIGIDMTEFEKEMDAQKERARSARGDIQSMNKQSKDLLDFKESSQFRYDLTSSKAKVIGLFKDGVRVKELEDKGEVAFDITPFYSESGGQVGDSGRADNKDCSMRILDSQKAPNGQHLHVAEILFGSVKEGDTFTLQIDEDRRRLTARNHSATHLLQKALTEVLGDHIKQLGSYCCPEYLRFDFSHFEKIEQSQLLDIEKRVNNYISQAIKEETKVLPIEEARNIGARAFFDEKYGNVVRVVCFGDVSKEFCGGTHVSNSQDIGIFVIESEESIASGTRRIQARTSLGAYNFVKQREKILDKTGEMVSAKSAYEVNDRLKTILAEKASLKDYAARLLDKVGSAVAFNLKQEVTVYNGYNILLTYLPETVREGLTKINDNLKSFYQDYVFLLIGGNDDKLIVTCCVGGSALKDGLNAGKIVKSVSQILGGTGGGRPDFANGAGKDFSKIEQAINTAKGML